MNPKATPTIGIVGAGVAGLAASVHLALKGYKVIVFEAAEHPGGKLAEKWLGKFRFDMGPSLCTMPSWIEEPFRLAGRNPKQYIQFEQLNTVCHYFYPDGTFLEASADPKQFDAEVSKKLGVPIGTTYKALQESKRVYSVVGNVFLRRSLHKLASYFRTDTAKAALLAPTLHLFTTLHRTHQRRLRHEKLVQLFNRFATYNGSDPYRAPGILSLIPHLEHNLGAYMPKGGMIEIPRSLYRLAKELGVEFHFSCSVNEIKVENGGATGLNTPKGWFSADYVVSNADVVPTYRRLLPNIPAPEKTLQQERSSSAVVFYWGIAKAFPQLSVHNFFFSADYQAEFRQIFEGKTVPDDLTIYLHISSKQASEDAPIGQENWFVMVNMPPNTGQNWDKWRSKIRAQVIQKLSAQLQCNVEALIVEEDYLDPVRIEERTGSYQGALYGSSSNARNAAFFRHPNFSRKIPNLFFCGGSVHPGGGIPLCLSSAKIVADLFPKISTDNVNYQASNVSVPQSVTETHVS